MTRRRVLILAAIVAALLLAADFHDLFVLPSLRRLWPCLGDVCGWLAKPIPMALVTLGASLALRGTAHGCLWWSIWRRRCCWVWRWSGCPERVALFA